MSQRDFIWLALAVLCIGWSLGYHLQRRARRRFLAIFDHLAARFRGQVTPGNALSFPRLDFKHAGSDFSITVFPGSSSSPHRPSPAQTSASFTLPDPRAQDGEAWSIQNRSVQSTVDETLGVIDTLSTGDAHFDERFVLASRDRRRVNPDVMDAVRRELLSLDRHHPRGVSARLAAGEFHLSVHEVARSEKAIDRLIQAAIRLQEQLQGR